MALQCIPALGAAIPVLLAEYALAKGAATMSDVQIPPVGDYRVDTEQSTVTFATRHMFGLAPVHGTFRLSDGHIHVAADLAESGARATASAASFLTGNRVRDTSVRSALYLDVDRHPDITFASDGIAQTDGRWTLNGSLTVRDVTRPSPWDIESARMDGGQVRLVATTTIDRFDFGLTAQKGMTGRRLALRLEIVARPV